MGILRYSSYDIVLQEVPNEISLCFTITGCPLACEGCHSEYTWDGSKGCVLSNELLEKLLDRYEDTISCVLFMGGEWEEAALIHKLQIARAYGLHTCLYTGLTEEKVPTAIKQELTWLKAGPWIEALGGLSEATTNQRFIEVSTGRILNEMFHHQ